MSISHLDQLAALDLSEREAAWARVVVEKVRALRYGTVQIKIHEAQVAVVETTEQRRFETGPKNRS
jgi:hypothetical protein